MDAPPSSTIAPSRPPAGDAAAAEQTPLRARIIRALRWTVFARFAGQALTWVSTLYVIRLLSPEDYGLISLAAILLGLCVLVNELGAIPALIQKAEIDDFLVRQIFGLVLLVNCALYGAVYVAAPHYAGFFGADGLVEVVRVLALQLVIGALAAVPSALLERELRLKGYSIVEFASMVVGALATLVLAFLGFGVWSLVTGTLAQVAARAAGILAVTRFFRLPALRFRGLGQVFAFGAKASAQRIVWHLSGQADVFLIGKFMGANAAGIYSVAANLASMPMTKFIGVLNQVAFPAYSRLQNDIARARTYFLRSIGVAGALFFPAMWGLSAVAPQLVDVLFGETWRAVAPVLQVLALIIPFRVISNLMVPLLNGVGRPGLNLANVTTSSLLTVAGLAVGFRWGVVGTACGLAAGYMAGFAVNVCRSLPAVGCRKREFFRELAPSAASAGAMYAVVAAGGELLAGAISSGVQLGLLALAGAAAYLAMMMTVGGRVSREAVAVVRACL